MLTGYELYDAIYNKYEQELQKGRFYKDDYQGNYVSTKIETLTRLHWTYKQMRDGEKSKYIQIEEFFKALQGVVNVNLGLTVNQLIEGLMKELLVDVLIEYRATNDTEEVDNDVKKARGSIRNESSNLPINKSVIFQSLLNAAERLPSYIQYKEMEKLSKEELSTPQRLIYTSVIENLIRASVDSANAHYNCVKHTPSDKLYVLLGYIFDILTCKSLIRQTKLVRIPSLINDDSNDKNKTLGQKQSELSRFYTAIENEKPNLLKSTQLLKEKIAVPLNKMGEQNWYKMMLEKQELKEFLMENNYNIALYLIVGVVSSTGLMVVPDKSLEKSMRNITTRNI